ncbi:hypothetical protein ACSBOB_11530 [Mesorhizobium sp. ASY16-5R]|uniref:hypothetical protein n=1 Tax=Mesorhizobium sp. ASY16-5R TaxID=3445772 RepID=UPI003F9EEA31
MSGLPRSDKDPVAQVGNLSAIMTVCALALEGAENWNGDIRRRVTQDIVGLLQFGADLAVDVSVAVGAVEIKPQGERQGGDKA